VVGTLDLFTRTSEGIRNTFLDWDDQSRSRSRLPRYFGPDTLLQPYNADKAKGQEYLYMIEEGKYKKEWYLFHVIVEQKIVLVSNLHVCYIRDSDKLEEWSVPIKRLLLFFFFFFFLYLL